MESRMRTASQEVSDLYAVTGLDDGCCRRRCSKAGRPGPNLYLLTQADRSLFAVVVQNRIVTCSPGDAGPCTMAEGEVARQPWRGTCDPMAAPRPTLPARMAPDCNEVASREPREAAATAPIHTATPMRAPRFAVAARLAADLEPLDLGQRHVPVPPVAGEDHDLVLAPPAQVSLHVVLVAELEPHRLGNGGGGSSLGLDRVRAGQEEKDEGEGSHADLRGRGPSDSYRPDHRRRRPADLFSPHEYEMSDAGSKGTDSVEVA